jgi:ubiquitin carboxyl-terminal hydrolase 8
MNLDYDKYKNKGISGLMNLGNTCFINSCIQVLSHTYELSQFLEKNNFKKKINNKFDSALLIEWDELRKMMWKENCIIAPVKFIKTVHKIASIKKIDIFTGYAQNDLPEFLLFVIDTFHSSLMREVNMTITGNSENETDKIAIQCFEMMKKMYTKEYSEIIDIFYGIHVSQIMSASDYTDVLSTTPEPYFIINLSIPDMDSQITLYDCFDFYVKGENVENENAWFNEKTNKKENVFKKISFWSFPNILTIDLKRFDYNNNKNNCLISFPLEKLDLCKYVVGYKKNTYIYDLYGICNHIGGVNGGHYTSFVKNASGKWYHFNDSKIEEITDLNSLITCHAYCLFYRKIRI